MNNENIVSRLVCPSCGVEINNGDVECSSCGIIFTKFYDKNSRQNRSRFDENSIEEKIQNKNNFISTVISWIGKLLGSIFFRISLFVGPVSKVEKIILLISSLAWLFYETSMIYYFATSDTKTENVAIMVILFTLFIFCFFVVFPISVYRVISKLRFLKTFSVFVIIFGFGFLVYSFSMDTDVVASGFGRVNNLGLMNTKQNYIIISGIIILSGFILYFISLYANKNKIVKNNYISNSVQGEFRIECPKCAEMIKVNAKKCRFCGFDIED